MHTVVAAALLHRREVLLCHRSPVRRWYPNVWDFPGGHVEGDESPLAALVREVFEELGIVIVADEMTDVPDFHLAEGDLDLSVWKVTAWRGEPTNMAPDEHDDVRWFGIELAVKQPLAHADFPALLRMLTNKPGAA